MTISRIIDAVMDRAATSHLRWDALMGAPVCVDTETLAKECTCQKCHDLRKAVRK